MRKIRITNPQRTPHGTVEGAFQYSTSMDLCSLFPEEGPLFMVPRQGEVENGYQRPLEPKRSEAIAEHLKQNGRIWDTIIFMVPDTATTEWNRKSKYLEITLPDEVFLHVVDGQHRLDGVAGYMGMCEKVPKVLATVTVITGINRLQAAEIFLQIHNQKPLARKLHAEVIKMTGHEDPQTAAASRLFDQLIAEEPYSLYAPTKKGGIARPTFTKVAKVLLTPDGPLGKATSEQRSQALFNYMLAAHAVLGKEVSQARVLQGLCVAFPEVVHACVREKIPFKVEELEGYLKPLEGFSYKGMEGSRKVSDVAQTFVNRLKEAEELPEGLF